MSHYPRRRSVFGVGELLVVGVGVLVASSVMANRPDRGELPTGRPDCTLSFSPPEVRAGTEGITIRANPSIEIDRPDHVMVSDESGLIVTLKRDHEPAHFLRVDPADAVDGEWTVTLRNGELDLCSGDFLVWSPRTDSVGAREDGPGERGLDGESMPLPR